MILFWLRRLTTGVFLILFVSLLTYLFIYLSPQSFIDVFRANPMISEETLALLKSHYHIDQSFGEQYFRWLGNFLRGDWGMSLTYGVPVSQLILKRLPATLLLTLLGLCLGWGFGLPLGIYAGWNAKRLISRLLHTFTRLLFSIPVFGLTFIFLFIIAQIQVHNVWSSHLLKSAAILTFALYSFAFVFRITEGETRRILKADFLWLLKVRGIPEKKLFTHHVLRHLFLRLLPLLGLELPALVGGSVIIEILTGWPGMGTLMFHAVRSEDLFLILGNVTLISLLIVLGNLLADWGGWMLVPKRKELLKDLG